MSFSYRDDLLSGFLGLSAREQEEFFALSCFEPAHWEESFSWEVNQNDIDKRIESYVERILDSGHVRGLRSKDQMQAILDACYHGEMVNWLLCKYLGDELGLECSPEADNSRREFDVTIKKDGMTACEIGIKRAASSSQMLNNLQQHKTRVQEFGEGRYSMLVTYFPITDVCDSRRVKDFLKGFAYMCPHAHPLYENDEHIMLNVPAPLDPREADVQPLRATRDALNDHFDLGR